MPEQNFSPMPEQNFSPMPKKIFSPTPRRSRPSFTRRAVNVLSGRTARRMGVVTGVAPFAAGGGAGGGLITKGLKGIGNFFAKLSTNPFAGSTVKGGVLKAAGRGVGLAGVATGTTLVASGITGDKPSFPNIGKAAFGAAVGGFPALFLGTGIGLAQSGTRKVKDIIDTSFNRDFAIPDIAPPPQSFIIEPSPTNIIFPESQQAASPSSGGVMGAFAPSISVGGQDNSLMGLLIMLLLGGGLGYAVGKKKKKKSKKKKTKKSKKKRRRK